MSALVRHLPVARYRIAHAVPRTTRPFVACLPRRFGRLQFRCDLGDSIAREVCLTGSYEPQETQLASQLTRPGDVVADVGANWGYFSLVAAHLVGPTGRVLALEPEPRLFEQLSANLGMNALAQAVAIRTAVGARAEVLSFASYGDEEDNRGMSRVATASETVAFTSAVVTLDDILDKYSLHNVRLVKIDVEGFEDQVLLGMRRGLQHARYDYVMLECHPSALAQRGISLAECLEPLVACGYELLEIDQAASTYRRAARRTVPTPELLRRFDAATPPGRWPHLLGISPSVPSPLQMP